MSDYTPSTMSIRDVWSFARATTGDGIDHERARAEFDRWLTGLDAEIRAEALEDAALALIGHIGIQTTNGIGWIPGDSLAGAARYLRHVARNGGTP